MNRTMGENAMNLLLWRHAEADDTWPDNERELTRRGIRAARQIAEWIQARGAGASRLLSSPALRCQQTAQTLGLPVETDPRLSSDTDVSRFLMAVGPSENAPDSTVIAVSHQPVLGQVAAFLLTGQEFSWHVDKGALWWFCFDARALQRQYATLRAMISPKMF